MKEIKSYVFLYNLQDVLTSLIAVIDFMKNMNAKFNPNPLLFLTFDSFSTEYTLKAAKKELELVREVGIILDYQNAIKGWIIRVITHYTEANLKHIQDYDHKDMHDYNETKESCAIDSISWF